MPNHTALACWPDKDHNVVPADRNDMRRARGAEGVLHILGNACIIAKQDAREQRGLRLGKNLRDDVLGARLE